MPVRKAFTRPQTVPAGQQAEAEETEAGRLALLLIHTAAHVGNKNHIYAFF